MRVGPEEKCSIKPELRSCVPALNWNTLDFSKNICEIAERNIQKVIAQGTSVENRGSQFKGNKKTVQNSKEEFHILPKDYSNIYQDYDANVCSHKILDELIKLQPPQPPERIDSLERIASSHHSTHNFSKRMISIYLSDKYLSKYTKSLS